MAAARRFEELIAWQKARELTREVYRATRLRGFRSDFGLSSQIQRASVSMMSNIAEGFERNRAAEFHQYLSTAKSSCAEVRSQLYVGLDVEYLTAGHFDSLMSQAEEAARVIGALRAAVERRRNA